MLKNLSSGDDAPQNGAGEVAKKPKKKRVERGVRLPIELQEKITLNLVKTKRIKSLAAFVRDAVDIHYELILGDAADFTPTNAEEMEMVRSVLKIIRDPYSLSESASLDVIKAAMRDRLTLGREVPLLSTTSTPTLSAITSDFTKQS